MIKFAKWMYELGSQHAADKLLQIVDAIPNPVPHESDFRNVKHEQEMLNKMSHAMAIYHEREGLKRLLHERFDPNYHPPLDDYTLTKIMKEIDNGSN